MSNYVPPEYRLSECAQHPTLNNWEFDLRLMVLDRDSPREDAGVSAMAQVKAIERVVTMSDFIGAMAIRAAQGLCFN